MDNFQRAGEALEAVQSVNQQLAIRLAQWARASVDRMLRVVGA